MSPFVPTQPDPTLTLGMDTSEYEDNNSTPRKIDWQQAKENGIRFMNTRASIGVRKDGDYQDFMRDCAGIIPTGGYHFLYPASVVSIRAQAKVFADQLRLFPGDYAPCVDYEYNGTQPVPGHPAKSMPKYLAISELEGFISYLHEEFPVWPWKTDCLIYTGSFYWKDHGALNPKWKQYPLWLGNYNAVPTIPLPWTEMLFWQFTESGDGKKYGTEANAVDLDYFMGDDLHFADFFGTVTLPPPPTTTAGAIGSVTITFTDGRPTQVIK